MKKFLIVAAALALASSFALWWMFHGSASAASLEEAAIGFRSEPQGAGRLLKFQDTGTPLRSFQWLRTATGGMVIAQVLTQTDRQQVALFQDGQLLAQLQVPRPEGISEGFYRFAQLKEAVVAPGDAVALLYQAQDATAADVPMVVALDLRTQALRWCHRAPVEHLALAPDPQSPQVFAYGADGPVVRLPLALQKGEREGARPPRAIAETIDLPPEVQGITDFLATGPATFLLAHRKGLSAYLQGGEWNHLAAPTPGPLGFTEPRSSLAATGKKIWWQPEPGTLLQVKADGTALAEWDAKTFGLTGPNEKDAALFHMTGTDPDGKIWFGLAAPTLAGPLPAPMPAGGPSAAPQPSPDSASAGTPAPGNPQDALPAQAPVAPAGGPDRSEWEAYLRLGLDRIYCWDPETGSLKRASWTECWRRLGPPSDFTIPLGDGSLRPASRGFLFGSGTQAWWLPLAAIPLSQVAVSAKALPPPELAPLVVQAAPTPSIAGLPGSPKG